MKTTFYPVSSYLQHPSCVTFSEYLSSWNAPSYMKCYRPGSGLALSTRFHYYYYSEGFQWVNQLKDRSDLLQGLNLDEQCNISVKKAKKKHRNRCRKGMKLKVEEIVSRTDNLVLPAQLCVPQHAWILQHGKKKKLKSSDQLWFGGWPHVIEWGREAVWPTLYKHSPAISYAWKMKCAHAGWVFQQT